MEREIPALEARRQFGRVLQDVASRGDAFLVERHGEPVAAIVSIEVYNQWRASRDEFFARLADVAERSNLSAEAAEALATEAVRATRARA
jgi:prevent-host-death family protein